MSNFFYQKGSSLRNFGGTIFGNYENRYTAVGSNNQTYRFKDLPSEVQQFIRNEEIEKNLTDMIALVCEIVVRVNSIEDHLTAIGGRLEQMSHLQQMMMTSKTELAMKLTDEKEEVRRLAEEILEVKRALGTVV